jgi:hypothetical protein
MKRSDCFSASLTVVALLLVATPSRAEITFCVKKSTTLTMASHSRSEVGVVIAPRDTPTRPIVKANNYYKSEHPAGDYWTSRLTASTSDPTKVPLNVGCYSVAVMAKAGTPQPGTPWYCASVSLGTKATYNKAQMDIEGTADLPDKKNFWVVEMSVPEPSDVNVNGNSTNCQR